MASPYPGKKLRWPSDKKKTGASVGEMASDFVPYLSNIANMFMRTPNPMSPQLVNPITNQRISLANNRREIEESSRAADMSTAGLDAHTGAAVRVGNLASKFRALSDVNSREALANAQITNQTNALNANIEAQNAHMTNDYRDQMVNARLARNRVASENLANASDKYIAQQATKDQMKLEKDKLNILSKMYTPGVYNRLLTKLNETGTTIPGQTPMATTTTGKKSENATSASPLRKVANATTIARSAGNLPVETRNTDGSESRTILDSYLKKRKFKFAAGGMMDVFTGDPDKPVLKDPVVSAPQFKGQANVSGTNAFNQSTFAMDYGTNRTAKGIDMVNSLVKSGMLPHNTQTPGVIRSTLDPKMYEYLYVFNQRPDLAGMTPEQKLQTFYNIQANDPDVQSMKDNMKRFGYGPMEFDRTRPSDIKRTGGMMRKKYANGGKMFKPFA